MIKQFQRLALFILGFLGILQCIVFPTQANITCVLIVWATSFLVGYLSFRERWFRTNPLSSLTVICYAFANLMVPLIGTSIDLHPLVENLNAPYQAFGYSALTAITISVAHVIYRKLTFLVPAREFISGPLWSTLGYFKPPTTLQLWMIGAVGCLSNLVLAFFFSRTYMDTSGYLQQFLTGLTPFTTAPMLIPIAHYFWDASKPTRATWVVSAVYLSIIAVAAMGLNMRIAFIMPVATLAVVLFLAMLTERLKVRLFSMKVLIPLALVVFLLVPSLLDLATAMRITRAQRDKLTTEQLVTKSLTVFFDKKKLNDYREGYSTYVSRAGQWDERYLNNEFLQRLTILKYTDNSLYYTKDFGPANRANLSDYSYKRFLATFPTPFLRWLGIYFNKWAVVTSSFGDFLYNERTGYNLISFRTGSFIGVGLAMHGGWFFLYVALLSIVTFWITDTFCRNTRGPDGRILRQDFSPLVLIFLIAFALFYSKEALVLQCATLSRYVPEMLIFYWIMFWGSNFLNVLVPSNSNGQVATRRAPRAYVRH